MRKTKIVCTIGPVSDNDEMIAAMMDCGMNVARLNFSHNTHEDYRKTIERIRTIRREKCLPVAIMLDTKGPEIRLKDFKNGFVVLNDGASFILTTQPYDGDETAASVSYSQFPQKLNSGDQILIDDGKIELRVEHCTETEVHCTVVHGGKLSNHKSINVPHTRLAVPYLSEQDKSDLLFGIENDVDFIAASFARSKEDVIALRKFMEYNGGHGIQIIAKIENQEGIENFDEILSCSDGIMVARGDMGVEVDFEKLPGLQKRFIRKCYQSGKMVITATQMLESMVHHPIPTRAEISDVANAVFDGTSAVMLSGETAAGKYPLEAVRAMAKIAEQAENDAFSMGAYDGIHYEMDIADTTNAVCDAACITARDIRAKAIIALSKYGQTARRMSKFRPREAIVAATPVEKTFYQLALSWGVYPVLARYQKTSDELLRHAIDCAKQIDAVADGDKVIIAAGIPLDTPGSTNLLKVETVGMIR
jgi:pyruvate kinase